MTRPPGAVKLEGMLVKWILLAAAGCVASGPALADINITVQEWDVPTPNSRPHDPAAGIDGSFWFTAMNANQLGRLDEKSGTIEMFSVDIANSGPHGLTMDGAGNIWFTANTGGYIGKLNPVTREIAHYTMPDGRARDPHTAVFDRNGTLWFTVQGGNFVGRLDPVSGEIVLRQPPTPAAAPYGMAVNAAGVPFFCEFGTNKIGRIHPETLEITEYEVTAGARPRRLTIAGDGSIYYTDFARGFLGRLDPETGQVREWASPGGLQSQPYGMTSTPDGAIWYSESGVTPNTLVRFDPAAESFQSWPVPSGGGVIRNMAGTAEGRLYIACSGVNKVGIVTVSAAPDPAGTGQIANGRTNIHRPGRPE